LTVAKRDAYLAALQNDLNTAEARAAVFDMVRAANITLDNGTFGRGNVDAVQKLLSDFDAVFDVLTDRDAAVSKAAVAWAQAEGRTDVAPELLQAQSITDEEIEALIAERTDARKRRNFARGDAIRNELLEKGIVIEDGKD